MARAALLVAVLALAVRAWRIDRTKPLAYAGTHRRADVVRLELAAHDGRLAAHDGRLCLASVVAAWWSTDG